jgi:hypothetical protein
MKTTTTTTVAQTFTVTTHGVDAVFATKEEALAVALAAALLTGGFLSLVHADMGPETVGYIVTG